MTDPLWGKADETMDPQIKGQKYGERFHVVTSSTHIVPTMPGDARHQNVITCVLPFNCREAIVNSLTRRGLVTPYGVIEIGQRCR